MADDPKVKALYNAARRYCEDHSNQLSIALGTGVRDAQHEQLSGEGDLLVATLYEIERALPKDFNNEGEVRKYLIAAARNANTLERWKTEGKGEERRVLYRERVQTEAERAGWENAKAEYVMYIANISVAEASRLEPVLYRHVLSDTKRRRVRKKLAERWDVDVRQHYWYPLLGGELPEDVLALQQAWFQAELGIEMLQDILLHRGIKLVWEVDEIRLDPEYELDPRLCEFWGGLETYWMSRELDWLIYTSHESSITFAGNWLINEVKKSWPNWEQRIYTGWEYTRPGDPRYRNM